MSQIVKSSNRTMLVFEYFSTIRRPSPAVEIEESLGLPQSSTSMLLRSLVDIGYLDYDKVNRLYFPSMRIAALGDWLKRMPDVAFLTNGIEILREETGETVLIGGRDGSHVRYSHILPSAHLDHYFMPSTLLYPLSTSVIGRALLSIADDEDIARTVRYHNIQASDHQRVKEKDVRAAILIIRETGISETRFELGGERDIHAIATLVPLQHSIKLRAIGVAGPRARVLKNRDMIIEALLDCVSTDVMGWQSEATSSSLLKNP